MTILSVNVAPATSTKAIVEIGYRRKPLNCKLLNEAADRYGETIASATSLVAVATEAETIGNESDPVDCALVATATLANTVVSEAKPIGYVEQPLAGRRMTIGNPTSSIVAGIQAVAIRFDSLASLPTHRC